MKRLLLTLCVLALGLFVALNIAAAADPAKGQVLAKKCSCHAGKKNLDGMDVKAFTAKMLDYQAGKGEPKSMQAIAKKLSKDEIDDLAAYYASLKK